MKAASRTGLLGWTISFGELPKPEKVADTELLIKVENGEDYFLLHAQILGV